MMGDTLESLAGLLEQSSVASSDAAPRLLPFLPANTRASLVAAVSLTTGKVNELGEPTDRAAFSAAQDILEGIGKAAAHLAILVEVFESRRPTTAGELGSLSPHCERVLEVLARHIALEQYVVLSTGEKKTNERRTLVVRAANRTCAIVFLLQGMHALATMLRPHITPLIGTGQHVDGKTALQEVAQQILRKTPTYETIRELGPQHAKHFIMRAVAGRFSATGEGPSKRAAEQDAAIKLLRKLSEVSPTQRPHSSTGRQEAFSLESHVPPLAHADLSGVQKALGYEFRDQRWLSIALVHPSWRNERNDRRIQVMDPLAKLGAFVLALHARLCFADRPALWRDGQTNHANATNTLLSDKTIASFCKELSLEKWLACGQGQQQSGFSDRLLADIVQACTAATFLDLRQWDKRLLASAPFELLRKSINSHRIVDGVEGDPKTSLQELAQELDLKWKYEQSDAGPDHAKRFRSRLHLGDRTIRFVIDGAEARSRKAADVEPARFAFDLARQIHKPSEQFPARQSKSQSALRTYLLARMLTSAAASSSAWKTFAKLQLLNATTLLNGSLLDVTEALHGILCALNDAGIPGHRSVFDRALETLPRDSPRALFTGLHEFARRLFKELSDWAPADSRSRSDALNVAGELLAVTALSNRLSEPAEIVTLGSVLDEVRDVRFRNAQVDADVMDQTIRDVMVPMVPGLVAEIISSATRKTTTDTVSTIRLKTYVSTAKVEISFEFLTDGKPRLPPIFQHSVVQALLASASCEVVAKDMKLCLRVPVWRDGGEVWAQAREFALRICGAHSSHVLRSFSSLAHEVKNGLVAIDARLGTVNVDATRRYQHLAAVEETHQKAVATSARMLALLGKTAESSWERFNARTVFQSFVADLAPRLDTRVRLRVDLDIGDVFVDGDPRLLTSVLENLAKNAVEAMNEASAVLEIRAEIRADDVFFDITDTGPGVSDSVVRALATGRIADTTKKDGSGVGLMAALQIAELHNGKLTLERLPTRGTRARLILPQVRPFEEVVPLASEQQVVDVPTS